ALSPSASAAGTTAPTSMRRRCAGAASRTCAARARSASMSSRGRWFGLAAAVIVSDQLTKWLILGYFANRTPHEELSSFLNLVLVFNKGAAFSLFASAPGWQTPLLVTFALVAAAIVSALIIRNPQRPLMRLRPAPLLSGPR